MKRLLLDPHVVLWWLQGSDCFKDSIVVLLKDARNEVFVSASSVWEIAIKQSLGKLEAPDDLLDLMERSGFEELSISSFHAEQAGRLPLAHKDPFDRMLIAQAQAEGLILVTHDEAILSSDYSALIAVKSLSYKDWIPAFAGMTLNPALYVIPAQAGIQPIK
jgi:PIN domain nuclease of toxin-antitoxin system